MKNKTGIVSISFRKLDSQEILSAASEAGIDAIEWGGDVHVPHGNIDMARKVAALTADFGLDIPEYGSYYIVGQSDPALFADVLNSAKGLGTKVIRVWPGMNKSSDTFTSEEYEAYVADAKRICRLAENMTIALECHPNSLTDEYHTALAFLQDVGCDNLKMMWQPNQHRPLDYNIDAINALFPYIVGVHVFSWVRKTKLPLADGESAWKKYISLLSAKPLYYMLEFMHDDKIETLKETAATLKNWLKGH